jgi:hypothetical protein
MLPLWRDKTLLKGMSLKDSLADLKKKISSEESTTVDYR